MGEGGWRGLERGLKKERRRGKWNPVFVYIYSRIENHKCISRESGRALMAAKFSHISKECLPFPSQTAGKRCDSLVNMLHR